MSTNEDYLRLSGLAGLAAGLGIGVYQTWVLDPVFPAMHDVVPEWMVVTHIHLLGLSLAVLLLSHYLDDVFVGYKGVVTAAAIVGQWGFPLTLYPVIALGIGPIGLLHNLLGIVMFLTVLAFAINYVRHGFGTAGE